MEKISIEFEFIEILEFILIINSDIIKDQTFEKIFGTSTSNGILIIANSLLLGFIIYYSIRYLMSHLTFNKVENPFSFIIKLIIFRNIYEFFIFYFNIIFRLDF